MSILVPARLLMRLLQFRKKADTTKRSCFSQAEARANPKALCSVIATFSATSRNFGSCSTRRENDAILASLPFFHSFGSTVTLWYPLIEGVRIVTYPNPLEAGEERRLDRTQYELTMLLATPTFLRGYLRKAEPHQLRSLRLLITGAEKLPLDLAKPFEERFGKQVFEGYGLTETSPVVSVNLPEPKPATAGRTRSTVQPPWVQSARLAPGIAAEIREPETDRKLSLHETGMLWLRGAKHFRRLSP